MWLDVGCGDGRCLDALHVFENKDFGYLNKISYRGIDPSEKDIKKAEKASLKIAKKIKNNINVKCDFKSMDALKLNYIKKYDIITAILLFHEVDPKYIPNILWNMLNALKDNGVLLISDFNDPDPFEKEKDIVNWNKNDIINIVENIGGMVIKLEMIPSRIIPNLWFYNICVKKLPLNRSKYYNFLNNYDRFLARKIDNLNKEIESLDTNLERDIKKLIKKRKLQNIPREDKAQLENNISNENLLMYRTRISKADQVLTLYKKLKKGPDEYLLP